MSPAGVWFRRVYAKWKLATLSESDFRPSVSILRMSLMAVFIGVLGAVVAWLLYRMIGVVTNLAYLHRLSAVFVPPSAGHSMWSVLLAPVIGGLIIGLMARFGSDRIRGHGIPEALEAILFRKSKMMLKVAVLKPLSAAVAIGTGGPFGAEGPIIMTGGAVGSLFGQVFYLTSIERRTLLVAGACAGMSATFGTPIAATLLAVELLLFELRPRSTIPVAIACFVAAAMRPYLIGPGPLFPVDVQFHLSLGAFGMAIVCGALSGLFAAGMTSAIYRVEDMYQKLPVHWMWWPAIGAVAVSLGGLIEPQALGVGYPVIGGLLAGHLIGTAVLAFMLAKALMWIIYLGSGTSGGVLAPLLSLGAALGGLEAGFFPGPDPQLWPLLSMGAMLAAVMRLPFTSILFALELTHNASALPALLIACIVAYGVSVFLMRRSILTEKISRRGFDIFREYSVDRLEHTAVSVVMSTDVMSVPAQTSLEELAQRYFGANQKYRAFPIVDEDGRLVNVVDRHALRDLLEQQENHRVSLVDVLPSDPVVAFPDESCRSIAVRTAVEKLDRMPVVDRIDHRLLGMVTRYDLLKPYTHYHQEESVRERFFRGRRGSSPGGSGAE